MKVLPIIFQPEMVRGLIRAVEHKPGAKTQTRRLRWGKRCERCQGRGENGPDYNRRTCAKCHGVGKFVTPLARVKVGDVLYVRENWRPDDLAKHDRGRTIYFADAPADALRETRGIVKWKPSIHLPRDRSRLTLAVTEVRFEPVQNISWQDAVAEGCELIQSGTYGFGKGFARWSSPVVAYEELWKHINGEASWDANPEVLALTFTVHRQNVDEFLRAGACFRETT